jgi:hypothetical protein
MDANGGVFIGFKGNWVLCFGFVLKHSFHALHLCVLLCMVEYIEEAPLTTLVAIYTMKSSSFAHA